MREVFRTRTQPVFDALAPAEAVTDHVSEFLLNQERAARLVQFHARDARNPGLAEVIGKVLAATWKAPAATGYSGEIQHTVNIRHAHGSDVVGRKRTRVKPGACDRFVGDRAVKEVGGTQRRLAADENRRAFLYYSLEQIKRFQDDPKKMNLTQPQAPPDGQPIGMFMGSDDCGCVYLPCLR